MELHKDIDFSTLSAEDLSKLICNITKIIHNSQDIEEVRKACKLRIAIFGYKNLTLQHEANKWHSLACKFKKLLNESGLSDNIIRLQNEILELRLQVKTKQRICKDKDLELRKYECDSLVNQILHE